MATYTPNLNLIKPSGSDKASPTPYNDNMDIIDREIGSLNDTTTQLNTDLTQTNSDLSALTTTVGNKADSSTVSSLNTIVYNIGKGAATLLAKSSNGTYTVSNMSSYRFLMVVLKWSSYYYTPTFVPVQIISALGGFYGFAITDTSGNRALFQLRSDLKTVYVTDIPSSMTFYIFGIK